MLSNITSSTLPYKMKKKPINNLPQIFPIINQMHFPLIALKRLINTWEYDSARCE